jgi:hypothetical protein
MDESSSGVPGRFIFSTAIFQLLSIVEKVWWRKRRVPYQCFKVWITSSSPVL